MDGQSLREAEGKCAPRGLGVSTQSQTQNPMRKGSLVPSLNRRSGSSPEPRLPDSILSNHPGTHLGRPKDLREYPLPPPCPSSQDPLRPEPTSFSTLFIPCEGQDPLLMGTGRCGCPLESVQPSPTLLQGRNPRSFGRVSGKALGAFPPNLSPSPRGTLVDDCRVSAKLFLVPEPLFASSFFMADSQTSLQAAGEVRG